MPCQHLRLFFKYNKYNKTYITHHDTERGWTDTAKLSLSYNKSSWDLKLMYLNLGCRFNMFIRCNWLIWQQCNKQYSIKFEILSLLSVLAQLLSVFDQHTAVFWTNQVSQRFSDSFIRVTWFVPEWISWIIDSMTVTWHFWFLIKSIHLIVFKGIVHFEIKMWYLSAYPKGIQDVGVFFSSVDPILMFLGQTVLVCQSYNGRYRSLSL